MTQKLAQRLLVLLVASFTALTATAQITHGWSIESTATCPGPEEGDTVSFSFQLAVENCVLHAATSAALHPKPQPDDEPTFTELRGDRTYTVDLASEVSLNAANDVGNLFTDTCRGLEIKPAKLSSRRAVVHADGQSFPVDDLPLFGDEDTRLLLAMDAGRFAEVWPELDKARNTCRAPSGLSLRPSAVLVDEALAQLAAGSIVYIAVEAERQGSGAIVETSGTGFAIATGGVIVTAHHILRDENGESFHRIRKLTGTVGGGRFTSHEIPLEILDEDATSDVALLKLLDPTRSPEPITACKETPKAGVGLVAYGFPLGTDFVTTPGSFSSDLGPQGRWQVTMDFTYGMSGGPVYDRSGRVRGIVKAGVPGEPAVRWVIPVRQIDSWLRRYDTLIRCGE